MKKIWIFSLCLLMLNLASETKLFGSEQFEQDSTDYSESQYMGKWGSINVDHIDEDGAKEGKVLFANPLATGTNFWDWGIQTKGSTRIELSTGSAYDISFKMKAESARGIFFKFVASDIGNENNEVEYFGDWISPEMTTEWQTFTYENTTITNGTNAYLILQWMGANEEGAFYIDDLQVSLNMSNYVPVTAISIDDCPAGPISGKYQMGATIMPDTASNKTYSWSGSDDSIAIVTVGGLVIPRKSGAVDIVLSSDEGGFTDTCHLDILMDNDTYYVSPDGDDANSGTGEGAGLSWYSIAHALDQILPGDTLIVGDGLYLESDLVVKNLFAYPERPTVIRSKNPLGAVIEANGPWAKSLDIKSCSYLELEGFEMYNSDDTNKGSGISISKGGDTHLLSHHISIRGCYVHDCGCGGIGTHTAGDYVLIENNIVRDNAKNSEYNCSGISIYHPVQVDEKEGYHIIVRGNVAFENECDLPFTPGGFDTPTDGNGIIVDDLYFAQNEDYEAYTQDILIENNLSFNNGGRGINIYSSDNVMVRNNTCWHNMYILQKYDQTDDVRFGNTKGSSLVNNLIVVNDEFTARAFGYYNTSSKTPVYNNVFVGGAKLASYFDKRDNQILPASDQAYPQLSNPTTEVEFTSVADFRQYFGIEAKSPAADAGTSIFAPTTDLDGWIRPTCDSIDIGAYEYTSAGNYLPKVSILSPRSGSKYDLGELFEIEVDAYDCDGQVEKVALLLDDELLMELSSSPYNFGVENLPVGSFTIYAEATDNSAETRLSDPIEIEILDTASTGIKEQLDPSIKLYPNPTSGKLFVETGLAQSLELLDMQGRRLLIRTGLKDKETLDCSALPEGSYFLRLTGKEAVAVRKVIVR